MTKLYARNGSMPTPLPFRIRLSDGRTRTDPSTFTAEEISDAGYVPADPRPTPGPDQVVNWGGTDWVIRDKTPEELAAEAAAKALSDELAGKAECARRILSVADIVTQTNLTANYSAGSLSEEDVLTYEAGLVWIRAMQTAWPTIISEGRDIYEDANWPAVPEGVVELASRY